MKIVVEVKGAKRFCPGTAHVSIDGVEYARLRVDELYTIDVRQGFLTQFSVKPEEANR